MPMYLAASASRTAARGIHLSSWMLSLAVLDDAA
jgi:hypothetical protein